MGYVQDEVDAAVLATYKARSISYCRCIEFIKYLSHVLFTSVSLAVSVLPVAHRYHLQNCFHLYRHLFYQKNSLNFKKSLLFTKNSYFFAIEVSKHRKKRTERPLRSLPCAQNASNKQVIQIIKCHFGYFRDPPSPFPFCLQYIIYGISSQCVIVHKDGRQFLYIVYSTVMLSKGILKFYIDKSEVIDIIEI